MSEPGERIIERQPTADADQRWRGRLEGGDPRWTPRTWPGRHVEQVIDRMNADLGAVGEAAYQVRE